MCGDSESHNYKNNTVNKQEVQDTKENHGLVEPLVKMCYERVN